MSHIALLAPVPLEHLDEAVETCRGKGRVAFGSRAWEVFRELDNIRNGQSVTVYIYASDDLSTALPEVTWIGTYIRCVFGDNGKHPNGMEYRPQSTDKYPLDNKGHWAVFWEIEQLRRLEPEERIQMNSISGHKSGKAYKKHFVPRGPLLVNAVTAP